MGMRQIINKSDIHCTSGSRIAPVYALRYNEVLKMETLEKVNEFDLYEFIQASSSKTDLALLRAQMQELGEIPTVDGEIVQDAALMPNNIHELYDIVNNVDERFKALPDSIKSAFKDKDDFLSSLTSGTFQKRLQLHFDKLVADAVKTPETTIDTLKKEGDK